MRLFSLLMVIQEKRTRSDSVLLWQKPRHQQKNSKSNVTTQNATKKSVTQRLRTDLWRSGGVTTGVVKVFPDCLIDDMTLKNISNCTVSYTALQMKTDLHFQPTLSATKFPIDFNSTFLCFSENSSKLCCIDITFSKMCRTFKRRLST